MATVISLRIFHIGKYFSPFSGGLENYMRDAMVALGRRGVESAALVHRHSWSLKTRDETITAGGHSFHVVSTGMVARLLYTPISPSFPWHLRRLVNSFEPDIIHLHLPNPSAFWVLALSSARRVPWVVHWHSDVITEAQGWPMKLIYQLYRLFERAVLKRASAIVVTSAAYRDTSEPLKAWASKCFVVPLGVDVGRFVGEEADERQAPATALHAAARARAPGLRVLAVGRLTYYKGFRYLIEAAAKVKNVTVELVGHGDQAEELRSLTVSLELQGRVSFHGVLSDRELAKQMARCDCLCLPSIERSEAFGIVLLEAMYFGKAIVASDIPGSGMSSIVDDGITGIKVQAADADSLAEAFRRLAADRDELTRMGLRGKEKFDQQFEINQSVEALIAVYQRVISTRPSEAGHTPDE